MYRFEARYVGRSQGQSSTKSAAHNTGKRTNAVASAAYLSRSAITDERTGQTWDYSRHFGGSGAELMLPENALPWMQDRSKLWNQIEKIENRKDSMLAPDFIITVPWLLTKAQGWAAIKEFAWEQIVSHGKPADIGLHEYGESWKTSAKKTAEKVKEWQNEGIPFYERGHVPDNSPGPHVLVTRFRNGNVKEYHLKQPHYHVMTTFRKVDPESETGFSKHKDTVTKRYWPLEAAEELARHRAAWARIGGNALEDAGYPLEAARFRVGHLRTEDQRTEAFGRGDLEWAKKLDRKPEPKKGPIAAKMEREDRGHEANAIRDWQDVKDYNSLKRRINDRQEKIVSLQAERLTLIVEGKAELELTPGQADQRGATQASAYDQAQSRFNEAGELIDQQAKIIDAAKKRAEEEEKDTALRRRDPEIADPYLRWSKAVAKPLGDRDSFSLLSAAARTECADFKQSQEDYRQKEAEETDPQKREILKMRRHIEAADYMAVTSERMVGVSKFLAGPRNGREPSESEEYYREEAKKYREIGTKERELLYDLRQNEGSKTIEQFHQEVERLDRLARSPIGRTPRIQQDDIPVNAPNRDRPQNDQLSPLNFRPEPERTSARDARREMNDARAEWQPPEVSDEKAARMEARDRRSNEEEVDRSVELERQQRSGGREGR